MKPCSKFLIQSIENNNFEWFLSSFDKLTVDDRMKFVLHIKFSVNGYDDVGLIDLLVAKGFSDEARKYGKELGIVPLM